MRHRQTCFCGEDWVEVTASSRDRSSLETVKDIPVRIRALAQSMAERNPNLDSFVALNFVALNPD